MLTIEQRTQQNERVKQRNKRLKNQIKQVDQRIEQDRHELNELLINLETGLEDRPLSRSHNSVGSSFTRMLDYIDKISTVGTPKDIEFLLETYRKMAERFYIQYELSLLKEIQEQQNVQKQSDEARKKMEVLTDIKGTYLETLLETTYKDAVDEEANLTKIFPTQLQKALDKLRFEWQRLNTIAVASKTITKDKKLIQALEVVVESARFSVGIIADRIAVVPGDAFALQFYSYLRNLAVLIVPIYSVQAPWEWSIFWHELAGHKVHRLEKYTSIEINRIRENLKRFYENYRDPKKTPIDRIKLLETITRNNQYVDPVKQENLSTRKNNFSQNYLDRVFSGKRLVLRDLGGFEHQFERMLENLPEKFNKFQAYEQIKVDGWCVDWFKELFEDAWSLLAIREPFIPFLTDILNRHVVTDGRHPLVEVRLKVAKELLNLMNSDSIAVKQPETVEESAAQQILKFISLLMAASLDFEKPNPNNLSDAWQIYRPRLSDIVGSEIGSYIRKWSDGLTVNVSTEGARKYTEEFIDELSDEQFKDFIEIFEDEKNQLEANYEDLLGNKDYQQLLALSFYDVDFGYSTGLTAKFKADGHTWEVSAVYVANNSSNGVFNITSTPATTTLLPDRTFSLTDIQSVTTWYSISSQQFNNNKFSFRKSA